MCMYDFREDLEEINVQLETQQKMEDDLRHQYNEVLSKFYHLESYDPDRFYNSVLPSKNVK